MEEYQKILKNLELDIQRTVVRSVSRNYSFKSNQSSLLQIGRRIQSADRELRKIERELKLPQLTIDRVKALNHVYANVYMFYSDVTLYSRKVRDLSFNELRDLTRKIDRALTVQYKNNARHNFYSYLKNYLEDTIGRMTAEEYFDKMVGDGVIFVEVTETPTKCFICLPWLGKVGTIGQTVEGYPRLDGLFPIHFKCVHRIVPCATPSLDRVPPQWLIGATRQDYYDHMRETEEGRKILREYRKAYKGNISSERVDDLIGQIIEGMF